jgi:competence protein ComEC
MTIVYGYFLFNRLLILRFKKTGCYNNRYLAWVIKQILIPFIISLSAVIGTMPLTIYYYGYLPIVSVIVNIFIIPMIGFILILGLFLLLMPGYWDVTLFFIKGVANLINLSVGFLYKITSSINKFSLASIDTPKPPVIVILLIIIVLYLVIFVKRKYLRNILLYLGIIITLIMIISSIKLRTNSIRLTVLDVGHGDAIHLRFPNGNCMLIDGGESSIYKDYGREVVIPFLKQERSLNLQYVVLSHPHKDHLGGLIEVLKVASIDTIILSSYPYNTILFKSFLALAKRKKIYLRYVSCGDQLYPDVNCRIYVLHPSDEFSDTYNFSGSECNNSSIVLKIKYGENSILLTGDIEKDAERSLLKYKDFLESEVLKVAHHGGINSCMMDFLNKVNPLVAVISVGGKNRFNQPADLTLNRLHMVSTAVLQTCNQGAVVLEVGAKEIKKVNWR